MQFTENEPQPRRRRFRWLMRGLAVVLGLLLLATLTFPWIISSDMVRTAALKRVNDMLHPEGRIEIDAFRMSWMGPQRLVGFTLFDQTGTPVIAARQVLIERGLARLIWRYPKAGLWTFEDSRIDVKRRSDGGTNLTDSLAKVLNNPDPRAEWFFRFPETDLSVTSPEFGEPLHPASASVTLQRQLAPKPLVCRVSLGEPGAKLLLVLDQNPYTPAPGQPSDLTLHLTAERWPFRLNSGGVATRGILDGGLRMERTSGMWSTQGDLNTAELEAQAADLGPDPVRLSALKGVWDLAQTESRWEINRLDLSGPFGALKAEALDSPLEGARIRGDLDLPALVRLLPGLDPRLARIEAGKAQLVLEATTLPSLNRSFVERSPSAFAVARLIAYRQDPEYSPPPPTPAGVELDGRVELTGIELSPGEPSLEIPPLSIDLRAHYDSDSGESLQIERLDLIAPNARLRASGRIDQLNADRLAQLSGYVEFDWQGLADTLGERLDAEVTIAGEPITFTFDGPLGGTPGEEPLWHRWNVNAKGKLLSARAVGLDVEQLAFAASLAGGQLALAPIEGLVNGGQLYLAPSLEILEDETMMIRLEPGSRIVNALMNEELSSRVLAFVVPILDQATRVNGFVSAMFERAELPLNPDGRLQPGALVEGQVVFTNVTCGPGPLADSIIALAVPGADPSIRLDQPVVLDIRDDRVYQRGLSLPLGPVSITMDGSVGFDRTMAVDVAVPLKAEMFASVPVFNNIARELRPIIPVRGTLSEPKLDGEALKKAMGQMGLNIANEATFGGLELLFKALEPKTPEEAAHRAAAAEARRLEMQRQRQERRDRQLDRRLQRQLNQNR